MKLNDIVYIKFLDHAELDGDTDPEPLEYEVMGRLVRIDKRFYTVAVWLDASHKLDNNAALYTIVRAAITDSRTLR